MPHQRIHTSGIKSLCPLPFSIAARRSFRHVPDCKDADCQAQQGDNEAKQLPILVKSLVAVQKLEVPQRNENNSETDDWKITSLPEKPVSYFFKIRSHLNTTLSHRVRIFQIPHTCTTYGDFRQHNNISNGRPVQTHFGKVQVLPVKFWA